MKRFRDWKRLAQASAHNAHEYEFRSRRGIYGYEDLDVLCIYNNNPYSDDPERRDREFADFREVLRAEGVKELAFASYPTSGEDAGYTVAMLIDAPVARLEHFKGIFEEITAKHLAAA